MRGMTLLLSPRWCNVIVIDERRSSVKTKGGGRELALPMASRVWRMLGRHGGLRQYGPPGVRAIMSLLLAASLVGASSVVAQRDEAPTRETFLPAAEMITAAELRQQMAMLDADAP